MKSFIQLLSVLCVALFCACSPNETTTEAIPLPEHPRPDFERSEWINLNGYWNFTFNEARAKQSLVDKNIQSFDQRILVPFPWGSKFSEIEDKGDIGWYATNITIPNEWKGKRVFLVIGASDWETQAFFDGNAIGVHQGGYTPFEFELTPNIQFGNSQQIVLRVDDTKNDAHLYGKQGYGNARGIWQTVYLEARGENYLKSVHFTPDIDNSTVRVDVILNNAAQNDDEFLLTFKNGEQQPFQASMEGKDKAVFNVSLTNQHLWNLDDPYLYEVSASLISNNKPIDEVNTYFGQRKISVMPFPNAEYTYVALNNKPIYLQLCLDQSYHPEGFYTFPSDEFMKNEIMLSKKLGLNGNRIHIKVEVPRKLYWADKLGLLIMADTPNFWGEPIPEAKADWEYCLREQVERDYNHPSIFAWVNFNETWGLFTQVDGKKTYLPETQEWARNMYHLTKSLDSSRLVEDQSACNYDHVESDINSWHAYKRGWVWEETIAEADAKTFPGSEFNYINGNKQNGVPMMNSECGNVWGYEGSAGDCDYTWDYHIMMNAFRQHPKCCGWLYTEHHDVINEWNGYVKFDRTEKIDGLSELVPGMTIADFQSAYYIAPQCYLFTTPEGGQTIQLPIYASFMTDKNPGALTLTTQLVGWDELGGFHELKPSQLSVPFEPYLNKTVATTTVSLPQEKGLYLLRMILANDKGTVLHHNFTTFRVNKGQEAKVDHARILTFTPASFTSQKWTVKQAAVLNGLKENGFGNGYFEYQIQLPDDIDPAQLTTASLIFEASSKQPFGKDLQDGADIEGDYMLGKGTFDPCKSPNSYAMTDNTTWTSSVKVSVNGVEAATFTLNDDPADHRGILSWGSQPNVNRLAEAGSYGQLLHAELPLAAFHKGEPLVIRFTVPADVNNGMGGLALYGKDFGRYPLDPTLVLQFK